MDAFLGKKHEMKHHQLTCKNEHWYIVTSHGRMFSVLGRNLYPPYLAILLISMVQWPHSTFDWQTLILNLTLLQAWIPIFEQGIGKGWHWPPSALRWVGVAWFLSVLVFYWQFLRTAARWAQDLSMKLALFTLLGLWLWTLVLFLAWYIGAKLGSYGVF